MTIRTFIKTISAAAVCCLFGPAAAASCEPGSGPQLQVLGSGGPIADDGRASSGYLVWADGRARVLIDAGGGVFLRFGEAGARFEDLDFIGLSHVHTDHSADLPALLKSGSFSPRTRPIAVAGPRGKGAFPGLESFLRAMLDPQDGAYAYLGDFLGGEGDAPHLEPREVGPGAPTTVYDSDDLRIDAMPVPHGIVPAIAFRVRVDGETFVFASDQNGSEPAFVDFAQGATVLVMHMVVPEDVSGVGRRLHAPPGVIGRIAARANPGKLVLSHFMARSLRALDTNVALVRKHYEGEVVLAEDLACVTP